MRSKLDTETRDQPVQAIATLIGHQDRGQLKGIEGHMIA